MEDRQLEMTRQADLCKRSRLFTLIDQRKEKINREKGTLIDQRKGNHQGGIRQEKADETFIKDRE